MISNNKTTKVVVFVRVGDENVRLEFEWNDKKRLDNILKHAVDFIDVVRSMSRERDDRFRTGQCLKYRSDQNGEKRFVENISIEGREVAVVYSEIKEGFRIISARRWKARDRR